MADVTATNPTTGETVVLRNGQWVPLQAAPATPQEQRQIQQTRNQRNAAQTLPGLFDALSHGRMPEIGRFSDPAYQAGLQRFGRDFADQVKQIPQINPVHAIQGAAERGAQAWGDFWEHPFMNTALTAAAVPSALWHMLPIQSALDTGKAQDAGDLARIRGDQPAEAAAVDREIGSRSQGAVSTAALGAGPLIRGPASAAAMSGLLTLPQSIASQQGSLQERLPQAMLDTAGSMAIAAPLGLLGRPSPRAVPNPAAATTSAAREAMVAQMERANVPPMAAALQGGQGTATAPMTMAIANDPIGGIFARGRLRNVSNAVQTQRDALAGGMTTPPVPDLENAGALAQQSIRDYNAPANTARATALRQQSNSFDEMLGAPTNQWGMRTKAQALYEHVLGPIEANRAPPTATQAFLDSIHGSIDPNPDPMLRLVRDRLAERPNVTLGDLRTLRERVQQAQDFDTMTPGRDDRQLSQLRGALTQDMMQAAGPSARNLALVDRYYSSSMQRIQQALRHVGGNSVTPRNAIGTLQAWASTANRQNTRNLSAALEAMRPDERRTVAASILANMGDDGRGGFDLSKFATQYSGMSAQGRRLLYGEVEPHLNDLGQSAQRYAAVKGMDNFSHTQTHNSAAQFAGGLGEVSGAAAAMALHGVPQEIAVFVAVTQLGRALGRMAVGELLTNPGFVRTLARIPRTPRGIAGVLPQLARLAARDPQLVPAYNALARAQAQTSGDQSQLPQPPPQAAPQTAPLPELAQ